MFYYTKICLMKNKIQESANTISRIFVFILGVLITLVLILLKYFDILHLDFEVAFAPFAVITLLTYGESFLLILVLSPISLINKIKSYSQSQKQQLTLKNL